MKEIERLLGVKKSLVYQTLTYYQCYGLAYNLNTFLHSQQGRRRTLNPTDIRLIKSLVSQDPCLYLDELQEALLVRRAVSISIPTIFRTLRRLHFSRKTISAKALERNDLNR